MRSRPRPVPRTAIAVAAAGLLLTACGGGAPSSDPATPSSTATTTAEATPTASDPATTSGEQRIVSLSPTATETLFAIGAGDQVVAADSLSTFPEDAPAVEDLAAFSPNAEAIAEYDPDLVVLHSNPDDIVAQLESLSIDTVHMPAVSTIEDAYGQMRELGELTGHEQEAADLVDRMQQEIASLVGETDVPDGTTYYHELDDQYYSATSSTFVGDVYGQFGMTSIADEASTPEEDAGYPQLSAEYILDADPDMIFLADVQCCGVTAESVAERPGWSELSAVANDDVVELPADIPSRWGPRIVEFVEVVAAAVDDLG